MHLPAHQQEAVVRLTLEETQTVCKVFTETVKNPARLWLFGSHADPEKRDGDIGLFLELYASEHNTAALARKIRIALYEKLI
ncbi:MAG: hypothetical protein L3J26_06560 [Candidatus Polarisedimenticolaceae bacterium]|nr:hypothetical protein [Candidatus Polarisedimenticolaceae bacterium]